MHRNSSPVDKTSLRRALNVRALIILAAGIAVISAGTFALHRHRKQRAVQAALAKGSAAFEAKRYTEAAVNYGRYLSAHPREVDVLLKYAQAQFKRRPASKDTYQQALSAWEAVLRAEPGQSEASEQLLRFYLQANLPIDAERVARAWLVAEPDNITANCGLSAALLAQDKEAEACKVLKDILEDQPECLEAAVMLAAQELRVEGGAEAALQILDSAVASNPESAAALTARAQLLLGMNEVSKAVADLDAADALESNIPATLTSMSQAYTKCGLYTKAMAQLRAAIQADPDASNLYLLAARHCLDLQDSEAGAEIADQALAADLGETVFDVLPISAELYFQAGRLAEGKACMDRYRQLRGDTTMVMYLEGLAATLAGEKQRGLSLLTNARSLAPKNGRIQFALGRAHRKAGNTERAIECFRAYQQVEDNPPLAAMIEIADAYLSLQRYEEASAVAMKAEGQYPFNNRAVLASMEMQAYVARPDGLRPNPAVIRRLYERCKEFADRVPDSQHVRVMLARLAAWHGRMEEAEQLLSPPSIATRPAGNDLFLSRALIQIYAEEKEFDKAIQTCVVLLDSASDDAKPRLYAELANLYLESGDLTSAEPVIESLVSCGTSQERTEACFRVIGGLLSHDQQAPARNLLARMAAEDPADIRSRLALLRLSSTESISDRQKLVDEIKNIEGGSGLNWRIWQARIWLESPEWTDRRTSIEQLLNECLSTDPQLVEAIVLLGIVHEKANEEGKALALYRQAQSANPAHEAANRTLLSLAARMREWEDVSRCLEALPADDASLQPYRISMMIRNGDLDGAEPLLREQIAAEPENWRARLHLASIMQIRNQADAGRALVEEARQIAPDSPEVVAVEVDLAIAGGDWGRAVEICTSRLNELPQPQAQLYAIRATVYERMGDLTAAEADWKHVADTAGWAERGYSALGQLQMRLGSSEQALAYWREGLRAEPTSHELRRSMAAVLLDGSPADRQAGEKLLQELLLAMPQDERTLLLQAEVAARSDPAAGQRLYEQVLVQHPRSGIALRRLAEMAFARGQRERAGELIERGLAARPDNLELLLMKAEMLHGDRPQPSLLAARTAIRVARRLLGNQPANERAALALVRASKLANVPEQAIPDLTAFVSNPANAHAVNARLALAKLHIERKEFGQADRYIQEAELTAPEDSRPVGTRLAWLAAQGQWDALAEQAAAHVREHPEAGGVALAAGRRLALAESGRRIADAIPLLEAATRVLPDDLDALQDLGLAHHAVGRTADARKTFERILERQPGRVDTLNNLAWMICEDEKDPRAAEQLVADAISTSRTHPSYAYLMDTWGVIQYRLGMLTGAKDRFEESRRRLQECIDDEEIDAATKASATFHLARTLAELDAAKGLVALEDLANNPDVMSHIGSAYQDEVHELILRLKASAGTQ